MQGVNKRQELADGLNQRSNVKMNKKSWHFNMELFSNSFLENFLKHKISGKDILRLDGRTAQCGSIFSITTAVENNALSHVFPVIVLTTYSLRISEFCSFKMLFQT